MSDHAIDFTLHNQVAVVTGAARGIGLAVATAMAHAGADVALIDLDEEGLEHSRRLVEATGRRAMSLAADVGDREAAAAAVDAVVSELSKVDILVNCAGVICRNAPAEQVTEEDFDRVWQVNVKGTFFCAQAAARDMIKRGRGRVVNFASQAALLALPHQSAYTASKGAIAALTRSLAIDWAPHGVTVNAIAPTFVWTPMAAPMLEVESVHDAAVRRIPMKRIAHVRDIAGAAIFLASEAASMITGHVLPVDGGWSAGEPGLDLR